MRGSDKIRRKSCASRTLQGCSDKNRRKSRATTRGEPCLEGGVWTQACRGHASSLRAVSAVARQRPFTSVVWPLHEGRKGSGSTEAIYHWCLASSRRAVACVHEAGLAGSPAALSREGGARGGRWPPLDAGRSAFVGEAEPAASGGQAIAKQGVLATSLG